MSNVGCGCTTGCETERCGCRKRKIKCDTTCKCVSSDEGCGNLAYCRCKTDCKTRKCSCQKTGINCTPEQCQCDPKKCVNHEHEVVTDKKLTRAAPQTSGGNIMIQETIVNNYYQVNQVVYQQHPHPNLPQTQALPTLTSNPQLALPGPQSPNVTSAVVPHTQNQLASNTAQNAIIPYTDIGKHFVVHYMKEFQISNRHNIHTLFAGDAQLVLPNNEVIVGNIAICNKLMSLGNVQITISQQEASQLPVGVGITIMGSMMDPSTEVVLFRKAFHLVPHGNSWIIAKMMFEWKKRVQ